jgi:hypothetical protein
MINGTINCETYLNQVRFAPTGASFTTHSISPPETENTQNALFRTEFAFKNHKTVTAVAIF